MLKKIKEFINNNCELRIELIRKKGWNCIPVPDVVNPMEAEWLADAIEHEEHKPVIKSISFEYDFINLAVHEIQNNRDSIMKENIENSHRYIFFLGDNDSFIYYKDQNNRYYLLCGSSEFIERAYKLSDSTAKIMFFNWVEDLDNDCEKEFLKSIWNKYHIFTDK